MTADMIKLEPGKTESGDLEDRTAIDNPDICPKGLAREIRHIAHIIAKVPKGKKPMEEGGPDGDPRHEAWVERYVVSFDDVEDGVVE